MAVRRLLGEPLLHFVLLGAVLFVAYSLLQKNGGPREPGQIVVTIGQIEQMATAFGKTWQRPPTPAELADLVHDRVREEVYCREAIALGLDRDDTIIRRRLRQKMEFVSDDVAALVEPTDVDLEAYLATHPDSFRVEPRFAFQQVYLDPQKHGENLASDAAELLAQLDRAGSAPDLATVGDPFLLEAQFAAQPASEIAKQFGTPFALALGRLPTGRWQGPIESGYGVHLVHVDERVEGRLPALAEVRDEVQREWDHARRLAANEAFYQKLLERYSVTVEGLEPSDQPVVHAATTLR